MIHKYIFQDIYEWAGDVRTVEIGKGNLFCTVACIQSYAKALFDKYFPQCYASKDNKDAFVEALARNYGDLNALHPFREGNGRAQREFARLVCLECGYGFDLRCTTHEKMLQASKNNFNSGSISEFTAIFSEAVFHIDEFPQQGNRLHISTSDDFETINIQEDYYGYGQYNHTMNKYTKFFNNRIANMSDECKVYNCINSNEFCSNEYCSIDDKDDNTPSL